MLIACSCFYHIVVETLIHSLAVGEGVEEEDGHGLLITQGVGLVSFQ